MYIPSPRSNWSSESGTTPSPSHKIVYGPPLSSNVRSIDPSMTPAQVGAITVPSIVKLFDIPIVNSNSCIQSAPSDAVAVYVPASKPANEPLI